MIQYKLRRELRLAKEAKEEVLGKVQKGSSSSMSGKIRALEERINELNTQLRFL